MNTNETNNQTHKRFSRQLENELNEKFATVLKTRYRNNFSLCVNQFLTLLDLELDQLTELKDFSNAVELSSFSEKEFIKRAVEHYVRKTIKEAKIKQKKLSEVDGTGLKELESLKGKFSAFLRLKACLGEIEAYNFQILPEQRIFITKTLLAQVTGANSRTLKSFVVSEKDEIDRINQKFELTNSNCNRNNIKAFQRYLESKEDRKMIA